MMDDVFRRLAYCEPGKSKTSTVVIQAFENIYRRAPNPVYLQPTMKPNSQKKG